MRRFVSFGPALVVLMTVVAVLLAGPAAVRKISAANTAARIVLAQQSLEDDDILERINRATRNVAETVRPSVVHIDVVPEGRSRFIRSTGTGWVFDEAGHIVTNAHVVRGAAAIKVTFSDGRVADAEKIHGQPFVADPYTDIAVFKVPAGDGIFPARRATGLQPMQGDRVFVFGSPFGFRFSMTEGIVSGLGRDPQAAAEFGGFTNFIQTDAAVNPGNSGGPLVDIKGRVIGMNVAIATGRSTDGTTSDEGQSAGISFAIPLGTIESVVTQLIERGQVRRGFLGIGPSGRGDGTTLINVPGLRGTGAGVGDVSPRSPAAEAGLQPGDVIVKINGQRVSGWHVLRSLISSERPGSEVTLRVARGERLEDVRVVLADRPAETEAGINRGAAVRALMRYGLVLDENASGPVVRRVLEDSPAEAVGFKPGQVIVRVGETTVSDAIDVLNAAVNRGILLGRRIPFEVVEVDENASSEPRTIHVQVLR